MMHFVGDIELVVMPFKASRVLEVKPEMAVVFGVMGVAHGDLGMWVSSTEVEMTWRMDWCWRREFGVVD